MTNTEKSNAPEQHAASIATLNKLRAAVLGANDGIVSTSSVVMGVAGATSNKATIFTAGMAALVAGALSMAVGEYVSVSSQSDAERALVKSGVRKPGHITSPSQAAIASFLSFSVGGVIPFLTITLIPQPVDLYYTVVAV
ncbi:MAG: VIT1/CCC1 transporter family protein, partial [Yersinia sp. (in: enterobacteria)]